MHGNNSFRIGNASHWQSTSLVWAVSYFLSPAFQQKQTQYHIYFWEESNRDNHLQKTPSLGTGELVSSGLFDLYPFTEASLSVSQCYLINLWVNFSRKRGWRGEKRMRPRNTIQHSEKCKGQIHTWRGHKYQGSFIKIPVLKIWVWAFRVVVHGMEGVRE